MHCTGPLGVPLGLHATSPTSLGDVDKGEPGLGGLPVCPAAPAPAALAVLL